MTRHSCGVMRPTREAMDASIAVDERMQVDDSGARWVGRYDDDDSEGGEFFTATLTRDDLDQLFPEEMEKGASE